MTIAQSYWQITPIIYAGVDKAPSLLGFSAWSREKHKVPDPALHSMNVWEGFPPLMGRQTRRPSGAHKTA